MAKLSKKQLKELVDGYEEILMHVVGDLSDERDHYEIFHSIYKRIRKLALKVAGEIE